MKLSLSLLLFILVSHPPRHHALDTINLKLFFGAQDLPLWSALNQNYFTEQNLHINYTYTPTSRELREGLANGDIDLALAAADNAVLTYESLGETVILMGGDSGMNEFVMVEPDGADVVVSFEDMRNRTLIVDWPGSAFALQAYDVLKKGGGLDRDQYGVVSVGSTRKRYLAMMSMLNNSEGDGGSMDGEQATTTYDGCMLNMPFSLLATANGGADPPAGGSRKQLKNLGKATDISGPYQSNSLFAMKEWINATESSNNTDKAIRFIAAWVKGLRWSMDPANKDAVVKILSDKLDIDEETAEQTYGPLMEPGFGLEADAQFLWDGFENVLRIREEFVGGGPYQADEFVDLTYYNEAIRSLSGSDDDDDLETSGGAVGSKGLAHFFGLGLGIVGIVLMPNLVYALL
mmetsp:Transcript_37658/g.82057  ORF Transcript_37658/g.82057 Transcript_37658/m.82057 type:complete len:405 (-) Transcript_37658:240-1454(-)